MFHYTLAQIYDIFAIWLFQEGFCYLYNVPMTCSKSIKQNKNTNPIFSFTQNLISCFINNIWCRQQSRCIDSYDVCRAEIEKLASLLEIFGVYRAKRPIKPMNDMQKTFIPPTHTDSTSTSTSVVVWAEVLHHVYNDFLLRKYCLICGCALASFDLSFLSLLQHTVESHLSVTSF